MNTKYKAELVAEINLMVEEDGRNGTYTFIYKMDDMYDVAVEMCDKGQLVLIGDAGKSASYFRKA